jgi:hypothetical protein
MGKDEGTIFSTCASFAHHMKTKKKKNKKTMDSNDMLQQHAPGALPIAARPHGSMSSGVELGPAATASSTNFTVPEFDTPPTLHAVTPNHATLLVSATPILLRSNIVDLTGLRTIVVHEVDTPCPITSSPFTQPVFNTDCDHIYGLEGWCKW